MAVSRISSMDNSYRFITLAIDSYEGRELKGRILHKSRNGLISFHTLIHMVNIIEDIFEQIKYPMKTVEQRTFDSLQEFCQEKSICDDEFLQEGPEELKGSLATIRLQVKYRYNATWQGEFVWLETNKCITFQSFLEFIRNLDEELGGKSLIQMDSNPNRLFRVAVDKNADQTMEGRLFLPPQVRQYQFQNVIELMKLMNHNIEESRFAPPYDTAGSERIIQNQALEVFRLRGNQVTFNIRVLFTENCTWQGTVSLRETGDTVNFRSFLELIMLMDMTASGWEAWRNGKDHTLRAVVNR